MIAKMQTKYYENGAQKATCFKNCILHCLYFLAKDTFLLFVSQYRLKAIAVVLMCPFKTNLQNGSETNIILYLKIMYYRCWMNEHFPSSANFSTVKIPLDIMSHHASAWQEKNMLLKISITAFLPYCNLNVMSYQTRSSDVSDFFPILRHSP